jgi:hypothetical protein
MYYQFSYTTLHTVQEPDNCYVFLTVFTCKPESHFKCSSNSYLVLFLIFENNVSKHAVVRFPQSIQLRIGANCTHVSSGQVEVLEQVDSVSMKVKQLI